jgi:hypothetical protein
MYIGVILGKYVEGFSTRQVPGGVGEDLLAFSLYA